MAKNNIGPRISDKCKGWLEENFQSLTGGAQMVLEGTMVNYRAALREMKGIFSTDELKAMVDVMNATILTPSMMGQHLPLSIQDAIALDGLAEKWSLDPQDFIPRLLNRTTFQITTLEWWSNAFWYGGGAWLPNDLEDYIKILT